VLVRIDDHDVFTSLTMSSSPGGRLLRCAVLVRDVAEPPITDAGLLVDKGKVRAAGPFGELARAHPEADVVERAGHVVLPGFVDAHSHARGLPREELDLACAPLERFLLRLAGASALDPGDDALVAAGHALATGITTVQPIYHTFTDAETYVAEARRVAEGSAAAGAGCELVLGFTDRDEFLPPTLAPEDAPNDVARRLLNVPRRMHAADFLAAADALRVGAPAADAPHRGLTLGPVAPQWCSDAVLEGVAERVGDGMRAHVHLLETKAQASIRGSAAPLARLREAGLLGDRLSAGHCVWLSPEGLAELADSGVVAVHNPGSNTRLRSGAAPVRELLDAGARVGLGLDSDTTTFPPDVFAELRRVRAIASGRGRPISAREALALATTGSAAALGNAGSLGTLRAGARADLLLVRPPAQRADEDLLDALVERADRHAVDEVWVAGDVVVEAGRPLAASVCERAAARLRDALGADAEERRGRMEAIAAIEPWALGAWAAQTHDSPFALSD
jgi:cytosine/adenosine deaminase-related metal-dependent hydrolase